MQYINQLLKGALIALVMSGTIPAWSQAQTSDELQAEREMLKAEMKSEDAAKRKEKYEKLNPPNASGVQSVDELARNSTQMLDNAKEVSMIVPEMYKRTIGETVDGVTDVTVKKPTTEELLQLADAIRQQISAVSRASEAMKQASDDAKGASPIQAPKATKSMNYSKDVISLIAPELELNLKVVQHLIATLASAKNY